MKRREILLLMAAAPVAAWSQIPDVSKSLSTIKDPLTGTLSSKLGVTENPAKGGVGSILTLAQEKLIKGDFDKITSVIPGSASYMDAAKKLGAVTGPIKDLSGLKAAFRKLGMSPETTSKFIPAVTDYAGKVGGDSVKSLLSSVLK